MIEGIAQKLFLDQSKYRDRNSNSYRVKVEPVKITS